MKQNIHFVILYYVDFLLGFFKPLTKNVFSILFILGVLSGQHSYTIRNIQTILSYIKLKYNMSE